MHFFLIKPHLYTIKPFDIKKINSKQNNYILTMNKNINIIKSPLE